MDDIYIAQRYLAKWQNANLKGIEFNLSFTSFKNMMRAKRCGYTGIELTESRGKGKNLRQTDRTIERIDNQQGYVSGNVMAICCAANQIKGVWENPSNVLTPIMVAKIANFKGK